MLALTRRKSETVVIGDNIEVVVLGIQGEQVKLGIIAPKEISVHRKEIYLQIQEENKKAANYNAEAISGLKSLIHKTAEK